MTAQSTNKPAFAVNPPAVPANQLDQILNVLTGLSARMDKIENKPPAVPAVVNPPAVPAVKPPATVNMNPVITTIEYEGTMLGVVNAIPKQFKTGSTGFYGNGKLVINGEKYQCQVQIVKVGSKSK